jgi:hypothetical protein
VSLVAARHEHEDPVFSQINSIVKSLSEITGLPEKHNVPYARISKRQLRQFLTKRIKTTIKPDELRADELSLKLFGLVPQDFDLKKSTIDLLTEQAAAFYDYQEKKLFLLDGSSFTSETTTVAHELSHALADQHFNLEKYMQDTPSNDDENLAHTATVEGQASWLMIAYDLKQNGQAPVPTPAMLQAVADSSEASLAEYPILKGSPLYIQQSLLFPYGQGILFFDAVFKKMGQQSFARVFTDPPVDSAQIIHPERYFGHQKATKPDLPKVRLKDSKDLTEGSMGEFDHEMLLRQFAGKEKAKELAPHLRGGQFKIVEVGKQKKPLLIYISAWESDEYAASFFASYQEVLKAKWKHCDATTVTADTFAGTGDNGYFVTKLSGNTLTSIEGLDDVDEWNRLKGTQKASDGIARRRLSLPETALAR